MRRDNAGTQLYVTISNNIDDASVTAPAICGAAASRIDVDAGPQPCCNMNQMIACSGVAPACVWCHAVARNNLTISVSSDLRAWRVVRVVMSDDSAFPAWASELWTGFQYVDWQFDGDDIVLAVRAAYRGAQNFHNSNRILFQRLVQWRNWL